MSDYLMQTYVLHAGCLITKSSETSVHGDTRWLGSAFLFSLVFGKRLLRTRKVLLYFISLIKFVTKSQFIGHDFLFFLRLPYRVLLYVFLEPVQAGLLLLSIRLLSFGMVYKHDSFDVVVSVPDILTLLDEIVNMVESICDHAWGSTKCINV